MRTHIGIALAFISFVGCKEPRTQIVVGIGTDLSAPELIDEVSLDIEVEPSGVSVFDESWPLDSDGEELPGSIGLVPGDDDNATFKLRARARFEGDTVVTRRSTLSFVPGETLFIRLGLVQACDDLPDDYCDEDQVCVEGACQAREIDSKTLPKYQDGLEERIACNSDTTWLRTGGGIDSEEIEADDECAPDERCQEGACYRPP
ncbi:MAG: hypothetical protein AABZ30_01605, partial [Myxococcota bacterium]